MTFSSLTSRALLGTGLLTALLLSSCDPKKEETPEPTGDGNSVFIINEGNFTRSNATVSLFTKTSKQVNPDLFQSVNNRPLGDVAQSMAISNGKGYIIVNNSNKIEVVSLPDFKSVSDIRKGVQQPRYLLPTTAGRALLTEWRGNYAGYKRGRVMVVNTNTNTIIDSVVVGRNPEQMLLVGNNVYVANSDTSTVSVLDATTGAVRGSITVSDGPSSLVLDKTGKVWVLCSGITRYDPNTFAVLSSTPAALIRFSPDAPTQQTKLSFGMVNGASDLRANAARDMLYYNYQGAEYRLGIGETALPAAPFIRRDFYGLNVDPADGTIYGTISPFTGTGRVLRYQPTGAVIDSFNVNVGPNGVVFY